MNKKAWLEIMRTGTHTGSNGITKTYALKDLSELVANFNPLNRRVPVVVGHPQLDDPAYGWTEKIKVVGNKLLAKVSLLPQFAELVKQGQYRNISVALKNNALRHIGFLGGASPAIDGLKEIQLSEIKNDDDDCIEYSSELQPVNFKEKKTMDEKEIKAMIAEAVGNALRKQQSEFSEATDTLKKELDDANKKVAEFSEKNQTLTDEQNSILEKAKQKEISEFCESALKAGKILPADMDAGLPKFLLSISNNEDSEFAEGSAKDSPVGFMEKFIERGGKRIEFSEVSKEGENSTSFNVSDTQKKINEQCGITDAEYAEANPDN